MRMKNVVVELVTGTSDLAHLDSGISIEILSVSLELFIVDDVVEKISADTLVSNDA